MERSEGEADVKLEGSAEVEKASRASTPLSELSSAPDAEEPPDGEKKVATEEVTFATSAKIVDGAKSVSGAAEGMPTKSSGQGKSTHHIRFEDTHPDVMICSVSCISGHYPSSAAPICRSQRRIFGRLESTIVEHR